MNYFRYIIHECNYLRKQEEKKKGKRRRRKNGFNIYVRLLPIQPYVDLSERRQESRMSGKRLGLNVVILTSRLTCAIHVYAHTCDSERADMILTREKRLYPPKIRDARLTLRSDRYINSHISTLPR